MSLFQNGQTLRTTILAMLRSAYSTLHELASLNNKVPKGKQTKLGTSGPAGGAQPPLLGPAESKQLAHLAKNFRQHIACMIDFTLDSY
jgi:hypothetical protein